MSMLFSEHSLIEENKMIEQSDIPTILVVDDVPENIEVISIILNDYKGKK